MFLLTASAGAQAYPSHQKMEKNFDKRDAGMNKMIFHFSGGSKVVC